MKLIYMAKTIEYIVNQSAGNTEVIKWATEMIQNNVVKETKQGTKYILIT